MPRKLYIILTVVIIVIVGVVAFAVLGGLLRDKPSLLVTTETFYGETGETATLDFEISNFGGDANGLVIAASSDAFSEASTDKFDVAANSTVTISCQVTTNDVESKDYPITLTYTADGNIFEGFSGDVAGNAVFHVAPSLEIVDIHWKNNVNWFEHIGNFTLLYFSIQSNSNFAAENAEVKLSFTPAVAELVVNPSSMLIGHIDPQATSGTISTAVAVPMSTGPAAYGAVVGEHPIQIELLIDGYVVDTATATIEVRG